MPRAKTSRLIAKRRVIPYAGRGATYAWLRTHAAEVRILRDLEQRSWALLIAEMVDDGVTEMDGSPPKLANVSRSWQRVVRDVAAYEAAVAALRRPQPVVGRAPPGTRPHLAAVQPAPHAMPPSAASPASPFVPADAPAAARGPPPPAGSPEAAQAAQARKEQLRQEMRDMSAKPFFS